MTKALYLDDSYLKEFEAVVTSVKDDRFVVLDQTAFYPNSGGQPHDEGTMESNGKTFKVVFVGKFSGNISHEVDISGLKEGDKVHCVLDWDRRYRFMKSHTAEHIVSSVVHNETGALISGNQIAVDKLRTDFSLDDFDREKMGEYIQQANGIIKQNLEVKTYYLPREEAMKIPAVIKLAGALPPNIDILRIVQIGDFDTEADGGTHVKNTSEIGKLELVKIQNKGKNNRRLYYKLRG